MEDQIKRLIDESIETERHVHSLASKIAESAKIMIHSLKGGNKILICGNGGSASQSQHFAGELVGRFEAERVALPCISLTTDTSIITAMSNDYGFNFAFERQIKAIGKKSDVLIAISTSGNSENIIRAVEQAKLDEIKVITLLGRDGGKMKENGDINIIIPGTNTARIQESHLLILHIFAKLIEDSFK